MECNNFVLILFLPISADHVYFVSLLYFAIDEDVHACLCLFHLRLQKIRTKKGVNWKKM